MITLKEYINNKSVFYNTKKTILLEGGQAAENLIPQLIQNTGNENLKYTRATPSAAVLNEVYNIYNILVDNNFIEPEEPSYILGSSRLFAIAAGIKQPEPNEYEPIDIINKALKTKKTFGDIDLDVSYKPGVTPNTLKTFINNFNPTKYTAAAFGDEISVATVIDNTDDVIQIDVVNIKDKKEYMQQTQFSSMADMAENLKGVIRDVLIRAYVKTHPIPNTQRKAIIETIKSTDVYKKFAEKNKLKNPDVDVRYSLGNDGLGLRIIWIKDNKTASPFTDKGVKYEKVKQLTDNPSLRPIGYNDSRLIAKILGFEHPEQIRHVTSMVKVISQLDTQRKQSIWDEMIKNLSSKIPAPERGRTQGQISKNEAKHAIDYMAKYFGNDVNTTTSDKINLTEALKMTSIPHFDQMTIPQTISFFEDENWEITEKADGSNVSFGIDENGIYVKSKKGNPVYNPQDYVDLSVAFNNDIHLGFAELLNLLINNSEKFSDFYTMHNQMIDGVGFQIFGELFSKSHMNVISYTPEKIGRGAVYIFMVKTDTSGKGNDITNTPIGQRIISNFINTFQGTDGWNFYSKRPVDINIASSRYKDEIINIINNNKDILSSRKKIDKPQKDILVTRISELLSALKKEAIKQISGVHSMLGGEEIEGVVVRNLKNGELAKIVDLEGFGAKRVEQWAGVDQIKKLRGELYNKIQKEVLDNADIFVLPNKQVEKLSDALEERGYKYKNVEDMINILYQDAVSERPRLKLEFKNILQDTINILTDHIAKVKDIINTIDLSNPKTIEVTKNSIQSEANEILSIIEKIKTINNADDFYTEVVKFFIGFKGLNNLIQIFLK